MKVIVWKGCTIESDNQIDGPDIEIHVDPYAKALYVLEDEDSLSRTLEWQ